jgi:hypothetical protein
MCARRDAIGAAAKERSKNDFYLMGKEREYLDYADTIESEE